MKAVVVHRGARDAYQVARAMADAGQLERLVTDLYWPADLPWAKWLAARVPDRANTLLQARYAPELPSSLVNSRWFSGMASLACEKARRLPFEWSRRATRWSDRVLGSSAGRIARRNRSLLISYSYYGHSAFRSYGKPGILFQLHPHPASVRRILQHELLDHPEAASSLNKEWELALPGDDFKRLVDEVGMAEAWIVASSFTRQTLEENGIPSDRIAVAPYGVDLERYCPAPRQLRCGVLHRPLRLLFVGRIVQRKGISYLLETLRHFSSEHVQLTIAGRPVDDLALLRKLGDRITIRCSVTNTELQSLYHDSDLLVLPSVAEGFGQVLLEALASGLPILATTNTAAPDLITQGCEGWFVPPRRPELLVQYIDWSLAHRSRLEAMRKDARARAAQMTWLRFRTQIQETVSRFSGRDVSQKAPAHV